MLIWMREGAGSGIVKFFLMGLLLLAGAGLVLMDVGGFFKGQLPAGTVVRGGDVSIGANEFSRIVDRTLRMAQVSPQEAYETGLINEIAASEIENRLMAAQAQAMGFMISDEALARQISKLAAPLETQGRSKREAIQQILQSQGISEEEFVAAIRDEMAKNLLGLTILPPETLGSPLMARALYRYDHEKRNVRAIVLENASSKLDTPPDEETLKSYYEENKIRYVVPETRKITMATLKPAMMSGDKVEITEEEIRADYERNALSYNKAPQRRVEQGLLDTKEQAQKAIDSLKAGKKMADILDDTSYLGVQEFEQKGLPPEIATPVFTAAKDNIIGPIETALGWHVLVVKDIMPEQKIPLAEVRDQIKKDLEHTKQINAMFETSTTIEDRLAGGDSLEDLVKDYGMTTETMGPFGAGGYNQDGADIFKPYGTDRSALIEAAFNLNEGEVSTIIETADRQFRLVRVDTITPESHKPFESVRKDVEKRWTDEQKRMLTQARAQTIKESLGKGQSIDQIAKENGASIKTFDGLNRIDPLPAPLTPIIGASVFETKLNDAFMGDFDDGFIVGVVKGISLPEKEEAGEKTLDDLQNITARALPQDVQTLFNQSLLSGSGVEINQRFIDQTYGRPSDGGGGS